jgi:5-methylcytosine-specific restriction endonuclease McrA
MRLEIILILVTAFLVGNIYTEGKLTKLLLSWKKYYQMAGIVAGACFVYWLMKKNPMNSGQMLATTSEYIKYMPLDSHTSSMITPILDFTSKQNFFGDAEFLRGQSESGAPIQRVNRGEQRILNSGRTGYEFIPPSSANPAVTQGLPAFAKTKRSVSETKKKFVASRQNWRCGDCNTQLNAWFEVDHKIRLEHGGSNHVDNLVALCRECHGKKTTIENL